MDDYHCPVCGASLPDQGLRIEHLCRTVSRELIAQAQQQTIPSLEKLHAEYGQARNGWTFGVGP